MSNQDRGIIEFDLAKQMMAKVIVIAVKEATGAVKVSMKKRRAAQEFVQSDWCYLWAYHMGYGDHILELRREIREGRYPVEGKKNERH